VQRQRTANKWPPTVIKSIQPKSLGNTAPQLVKIFPSLYGFYGTWWFSTVFTTACHLFVSQDRWIQSTSCHPISSWFILIFSSNLWLAPKKSFLQVSPHKPCMYSYSPYVPHTFPILYSWFDHPKNTQWGVQIIQLLIL